MGNRMMLLSIQLLAVAIFADASAFLESKLPSASDLITKSDVEQTLLSELSSPSHALRLHEIEEELRPMFTALPKGGEGTLEPSTVRYALHRYFVQKHGWYVRGLEPAGGAWNSSSPTEIMKDRAPAYILGLLEQRLHGQGLGIHELAAFAATLSDLVHGEAAGALLEVFRALDLPTVGAVSRFSSDMSIKAYLMMNFIGLNATGRTVQDLNLLEKEIVEIYPSWPGTYMWVTDLRETLDLSQQSRGNPFQKSSKDSYETSAGFVQEMGHRFGTFQNLECHDLKGRLVEMEHQGTGRVRLSRFYAGGLEGDWTFTESVDYLRNLGALDETDARRPSVVIPNYMTSQTNCLTSSGFYSVCCSDECEGLLQHVERKIQAPSATPAHLVEVIAALPSDTVDAPRNLSSVLTTRLDEIAEFHGGRVPLYGRLFSQWMHHAYPRECPFPHVTGTTSPMSPDEWMHAYGEEALEASEEEMRRHHQSHHEEQVGTGTDTLPWTAVEELVAEYSATAAGDSTASWAPPSLRTVMALAVLLSFLVPLVQASRAVATATTTEPKSSERFLV